MSDCCYPLSLQDDRGYPKNFRGNVIISDIDKTYLSTNFSSFKGLARIPLEFAVDKSAVLGMPEILKGLRAGPGPEFACTPLYFVSASPPQLRKVIERRMLLDYVQFDGITFKDWFRTIKQGKFHRLSDHVGFKLCALLVGRQSRPMCQEFLFGDDVEQDARAYSLYEQLLEGVSIERELVRAGVSRADRKCIQSLRERLPSKPGPVGRIFIYLERKTPCDQLLRFGAKITPVRSSFQLSLALFELGLVGRRTVDETLAVLNLGASIRATQVEDALSRGLIGEGRLALGEWG